MGGTGYIPDGAKENYGKSHSGSEQRNDSNNVGLPHPDSLKRPSTAGEAEKMLNLGKKMFSVSLQWAEERGRCVSRADAGVLQSVFSTILSKMKVRGKRR